MEVEHIKPRIEKINNIIYYVGYKRKVVVSKMDKHHLLNALKKAIKTRDFNHESRLYIVDDVIDILSKEIIRRLLGFENKKDK